MSKKEEDTELETAETIKVGSESVNIEEQGAAEEKKSSRITLILLAMVVVILGALAANGQLKPLYHSFTGWITSFLLIHLHLHLHWPHLKKYSMYLISLISCNWNWHTNSSRHHLMI